MPGDALGGGLGAVGDGEGVHDEDVPKACQALGQGVVVGLLSDEEPRVLQQRNRPFGGGGGFDAGQQGHASAEQLPKPRSHRRQREGRIELAFLRTAQMG